MITNLQELISPLTEREFRALLRGRTLFLHRSKDATRYHGLLNWETLRSLVETNALPADQFMLSARNRPLPETLYVTNGKVDAASLSGLFSRDVSLITKRIEGHVAVLNLLCADASRRLRENVGAAAIATCGDGGALELHFDAPDVLALQIEGSKRWRVYDRPIDHPIKGTRRPDPPQTEPVFDEILHAGDMLLVPGGHWHHCDNDGPGVSLHVSILITAPTGWHAMRWLMPQLLEEDAFRVPLSRFDDPAERIAHEAALKEALIEKVRFMPMFEFASEALDRSAANSGRAPTPDSCRDGGEA